MAGIKEGSDVGNLDVPVVQLVVFGHMLTQEFVIGPLEGAVGSSLVPDQDNPASRLEYAMELLQCLVPAKPVEGLRRGDNVNRS